MLPVSLDCVVLLLCFCSSCVPYVASFSGLCCAFAVFLEEKHSKSTTQSRETGNIVYTRRTKTQQNHNTIQRNWQHRVHKKKKNIAKAQHNPEKLAT
jgi:hypothetical protein